MGRKRRVVEPEEELEEQDELTDGDDAEEEGAAPSPDPHAETIRQLRADLDAEKAERLRLEGEVRARPRESSRPEPEETLSDQEIDEAIAAGGSRAREVMQKAARIESKKVAKSYEERIAGLETNIAGYGLPALARHEAHISSQGLTFYQDYKDEIQKRLEQLPMATRTQPEAIKQIYALVAGEHLDEIVNRRVDEALRKANGDPNARPTGSRGRGAGDTSMPSLDKLFGESEARMILEKHGNEDAWAKKQGFADYAGFLKETGQLEVKGNA